MYIFIGESTQKSLDVAIYLRGNAYVCLCVDTGIGISVKVCVCVCVFIWVCASVCGGEWVNM